MYVRNFLNAGDFLVVVPVGIPITLQYDVNGNLEKVFQGYEEDMVDMSEELFDIFLHSHLCPLKVSVSGGTSWVYGVLYTSKFYDVEGKLPEAMLPNMLEDFCLCPESFSFFAGHLKSVANILTGSAANNQWLSMAGFNVLPGYLIHSELNKDAFDKMVNNGRFNFRYPYIMNYFVYRGKDFICKHIDSEQHLCKAVQIKLSPNGEFIAVVTCDGISLTVGYNEVVSYNIQKGSLLLLDENSSIVCSTYAGKRLASLTNVVNCPVCHKLVHVIENEVTMCDDSHCLSRRYNQLCNFCRVLKLEPPIFEDYLKYVDEGSITRIVDYIDVVGVDVSATVSDVLKAFITVQNVPDTSVIDKFVYSCNNNIETILYYMKNPGRISIDFDMKDVNSSKLISWFADNKNVEDFESFIYHPNTRVTNCEKKFDGDPIFRNKTITVTGTFKHGSITDVCAILQSYSAVATTKLLEETDCVLVGDIPEEINGSLVKKASKQGIPVYSESYFFNYYDIDKDLAQNLS